MAIAGIHVPLSPNSYLRLLPRYTHLHTSLASKAANQPPRMSTTNG